MGRTSIGIMGRSKLTTEEIMEKTFKRKFSTKDTLNYFRGIEGFRAVGKTGTIIYLDCDNGNCFSRQYLIEKD